MLLLINLELTRLLGYDLTSFVPIVRKLKDSNGFGSDGIEVNDCEDVNDWLLLVSKS